MLVFESTVSTHETNETTCAEPHDMMLHLRPLGRSMV
jgi:hypothetical protein